MIVSVFLCCLRPRRLSSLFRVLELLTCRHALLCACAFSMLAFVIRDLLLRDTLSRVNRNGVYRVESLGTLQGIVYPYVSLSLFSFSLCTCVMLVTPGIVTTASDYLVSSAEKKAMSPPHVPTTFVFVAVKRATS